MRRACDVRPYVEVHLHDAGHAFDDSEAPMFYDEAASAAAWEQTRAFLARHLPTP